ncbi:hypothetical protein [Sporolactobacillus shoreicorticis]|uniref:Transposase DDE domain-containing protein n=1 Tax=Sporolactobacillus shoreicorticis TaxID=1923877 RepID=A0ABW5S3N8_9BACL
MQYQDSCERNQVESKFSTLKTFHGLERLCSRLKETSELEIELAILGLNLCKRVRTFFVVFSDVLFWTFKIQIIRQETN